MPLSPKARYRILLWFCIGSSLLGIIIAVCVTKDPADGGRGGAVAVALALFNLFINKGYGLRLYEARTKVIPKLIASFQRLGHLEPAQTPAPAAETAEAVRDGLIDAVNVETKEQAKQNLYLAISTFAGTLVWGFGDIISRWVINLLARMHGAR